MLCGTLCKTPSIVEDTLIHKLVKKEGKGRLSKETEKLLLMLDHFTVQLAFKIPQDITALSINKKAQFKKRDDDDIETSECDLGWTKNGDGFDDWTPIVGFKTIDEKVSKNFTVTTLDEDDFFQKREGSGLEFLKKIIFKLYQMAFPLCDCIVKSPSDEVAAQLLKDLHLNVGMGMPESYNTNFDLQSDESFSRMFFYGIGAPLLAAQEEVSGTYFQRFGPFQVDMPIHNLKVRKGFRPYGARVYFNKDQCVVAIFDYAKSKYFYPNHTSTWEQAKCLAKVTAMVIVTAQEHLASTHLIVANSATVASTLELRPSHPIRRLLTIFTFNSTEINKGAFKMLVPKEMLLHRGTGLEYDSIIELFDCAFKKSIAFKPFSDRDVIPELRKLSNGNKFPYINQGEEYYEIVRSFVSEWLISSGEEAYDEEAINFYNRIKKSTEGQAYEIPNYSSLSDMIDVCSQIIFTVTAYHELVGTVVDYSRLPNRAGFRLCYDEKQTDIQGFLIQALITSTTNIEMPLLMSPYEKFFGAEGAPKWEIEVWGQFMSNLTEQSIRVQKQNNSRDVEFHSFDPQNFECSVSV